MRRWSLTLFLMIAAGVAVAFAPRLLAAVGVTPALSLAPPAPVGVHEALIVDTGTVVPERVEPVVPVRPVRPPPPPPAVAAIPEVPPRPVAPPPARPVGDPGLLIPELDEEPGVDWADVPPPTAPAPDPSFWDDCPGCGMG